MLLFSRVEVSSRCITLDVPLLNFVLEKNWSVEA